MACKFRIIVKDTDDGKCATLDSSLYQFKTKKDKKLKLRVANKSKFDVEVRFADDICDEKDETKFFELKKSKGKRDFKLKKSLASPFYTTVTIRGDDICKNGPPQDASIKIER